VENIKMATIKIRRGTTDPITITPSGVTAGEPIFNTTLNKLFVHNGTTGIWVGAEVDNGTGLGSSQTKIPTQYAVKTYVDNNLSSGAVTSINGVTGAARFGAGTGISITPGTDPDKGITITNIGVQSAVAGTGISVSGSTGAVTFTNTGVQSLNGLTGAVTNVARTNQGNTFSVQQVMNQGITTSQLNVAGSLAQFNTVAGQISFGGTATYLQSVSTIVQNTAALLTITPNTMPGANATLRLQGSDGDIAAYNNDIKPQSTQTGNLTHTLPATTGTLLNSAVTSAVAGTGISVSGSTGAVTFTNTGVQSVVQGNQITVSGATGAVTIAVTATPSFTSITTTGNGTVGGDLTVTGNLTINGTSTTVNTDTMTVDDPLITIGTSGGLPLSVTDGGKDRGIVFNYYDTAGRTGFFGWDASTPEFVFQQSSTVSGEIVTGVTYGNVHVANLRLQNGAVTDTVIGSTSGSQTHQFRNYGGIIVNSNAEPTTGYILRGNSTGSHTWQDPNAAGFTAYAAGRLTPRNIALTGEVTGTVSFDGTADVSISTTIAANSVALGTDTTGNYAQDVSVAGIGLSISGAAGEGTQYIITSGATSANTASQIVARDASGNFTAGTITANLTGNVSGSAASLTTARTFSLTGNVTATGITFDGTGNVALATTIGSGVVTNAMLANSGFTLGSTNIALGSTTTTIAGFSSVTSTTFTGSLSGTATTATNVTLTEATSANTTDLYPTFIASGATGGLLIDATTQSGLVALSYRPSTGIFTAYKVEAIVDGGSY